MNTKDIIQLVLFVVIIGIFLYMLKIIKAMQPQMVTDDGNIVDTDVYSPSNSPARVNNNLESVEKKTRKTRVKITMNRLIRILRSDDKPRSADTMLADYNDKHKPVSISNIKAWLKWLQKNQLVNSEEMEDGLIIWGLSEWFSDGELQEEYFTKAKQV